MRCKIRPFRKYLYLDTILKFINLKQAHTGPIYNIFEKKLYCQIRNVWENFCLNYFEIKNCYRVKNSKD